jgi:hypothetical protein
MCPFIRTKQKEVKHNTVDDCVENTLKKRWLESRSYSEDVERNNVVSKFNEGRWDKTEGQCDNINQIP